MITETKLPTEYTAERVVGTHCPDAVTQVKRFDTGLCHYVYEVTTQCGAQYVVRIASPDSRDHLEGGLFWHPILRDAGVPVPTVYASGVLDPFAYMLMERLPGTDLGAVYGELTSAQKKSIASAVADIQETVRKLPASSKYGYAFSYNHSNAKGKVSWTEVVNSSVARSEQWIRKVGRIDVGFVARVRAFLADHEGYLRRIEPVPFLDDTTTKNVIIHEGRLSGVVDTDMLCFGDPISTVGLTNMALLSSGMDTEYIDFWLDAIQANKEQRSMVQVYSLECCLCFMGELGQAFNNERGTFDDEQANILYDIFEFLSKGSNQ